MPGIARAALPLSHLYILRPVDLNAREAPILNLANLTWPPGRLLLDLHLVFALTFGRQRKTDAVQLEAIPWDREAVTRLLLPLPD